MKKAILFLAILAFSKNLNAQTEIKANPIALLFEAVMVSVEHGFNDDFSLDADIWLAEEFGGFSLSQKYYFFPKVGLDHFHVGIFEAVQQGSAGIGFLAGYKLVSKRNVVFDLGAGIGRSFDDGGVGYLKFHLGYRFGKKAKTAPVQ